MACSPYSILVLGFTYESYINLVFLLQKRAVRAIAFKRSTPHSTFIFSGLNISELYGLFQLKLLTFVYESIHKISPPCFHNIFNTLASVYQYGTQQAGKGDISLTQKNTQLYGLQSIQYHGSTCCNTIPLDIKQSPSVHLFRQRLEALFFENNY